MESRSIRAGHHSQVVQIGGHILRDQAQQENQQESDDENKNGNQDEFSAQIAVMQAAHGDRRLKRILSPATAARSSRESMLSSPDW